MPELEKWASFHCLNDPQLQQMLVEAWRFKEAVKADKQPHWLCFLGTSGAGKTHLARRLWRYWENGGRYYEHPCGAQMVKRGQWCSWRMFGEEMLRGDYSRTSDLCCDSFVVLDDIASKRDKSGIGVDKLDTILDARRGKWTVVTANLSIAQISEQMDARIASRLMRDGAVVLDVDVQDYGTRRMPAV
jgi:DNA replication protein DnaC